MSYREMYANEKYCRAEINEARKIFTTKPFTFEKGDALLRMLLLMLVYCPENLKTLVEATIIETEMRMKYAVLYPEANHA